MHDLEFLHGRGIALLKFLKILKSKRLQFNKNCLVQLLLNAVYSELNFGRVEKILLRDTVKNTR